MSMKGVAVSESTLAGWHLKKEVTIGQILSIVTMLITFVTWAISIETRLAVQEKTATAIEQRIERDGRATEKVLDEIKASLLRIEDKIEKKADKFK